MQQFAAKAQPFRKSRFTNVSFEPLRYCGVFCAVHCQACRRTFGSRRASFGQENGEVKRLFGLTLSQEDEPEPQKKNKKIHV
jgi:hypothetical protein